MGVCLCMCMCCDACQQPIISIILSLCVCPPIVVVVGCHSTSRTFQRRFVCGFEGDCDGVERIFVYLGNSIATNGCGNVTFNWSIDVVGKCQHKTLRWRKPTINKVCVFCTKQRDATQRHEFGTRIKFSSLLVSACIIPLWNSIYLNDNNDLSYPISQFSIRNSTEVFCSSSHSSA